MERYHTPFEYICIESATVALWCGFRGARPHKGLNAASPAKKKPLLWCRSSQSEYYYSNYQKLPSCSRCLRMTHPDQINRHQHWCIHASIEHEFHIGCRCNIPATYIFFEGDAYATYFRINILPVYSTHRILLLFPKYFTFFMRRQFYVEVPSKSVNIYQFGLETQKSVPGCIQFFDKGTNWYTDIIGMECKQLSGN